MVPFAEVVLLTAMEYHRSDESHGLRENIVMEMHVRSPEEDEPEVKGRKRFQILQLKTLGDIFILLRHILSDPCIFVLPDQ